MPSTAMFPGETLTPSSPVTFFKKNYFYLIYFISSLLKYPMFHRLSHLIGGQGIGFVANKSPPLRQLLQLSFSFPLSRLLLSKFQINFFISRPFPQWTNYPSMLNQPFQSTRHTPQIEVFLFKWRWTMWEFYNGKSCLKNSRMENIFQT